MASFDYDVTATRPIDPAEFETLRVRTEGSVLFAGIAAPPMNLLGPELVRDLVSLIRRAEADDTVRVLVFSSTDPDYFISHVDVTQIAEYRHEAAKLTGEPSLALLFRHLSASRLITIAQIEGRVRAAGSEFALACDMRFAARESAIFGQIEPALGLLPGGGATQYLVRLMGRGRALEVLLGAEDFDADLAERYGWINRALPADELADFVSVARSADRRVSGRRARRRQGTRQCDRTRVDRGVPSGLGSVRRGCAHRRGAAADPGRDAAGHADAGRGTRSGTHARRVGRQLNDRTSTFATLTRRLRMATQSATQTDRGADQGVHGCDTEARQPT